MTDASSEIANRGAELNLGKRALYMVFYAIAMRLAELVVFLVMVSQFIAKAVTKNPISSLTAFGDQLSRYIAQIVRFQTFNTDELAFPFSGWPENPDTNTPPREQRSDADPSNTQQPGPA